MPVNLKGRSFLTLKDYTPQEIRYLLDLSHALKQKKRLGSAEKLLAGRNVALIFEKTSTRTRCSFEVACMDEGAGVTCLTGSQMGKKESLEDTARVLGRYYDGIGFRGFKQSTVCALAEFSGVPVWNGLTDDYHPTQILADFMTMEEQIHKPLSKMKLCYIGDARFNMANSLLIGSARMGLDFTAIAPRELWPSAELVAEMKRDAQQTGAKITITDDMTAVHGADALYTDVWVSMGEEDQFETRIRQLQNYRVTMDTLRMTGNPDVIFMHCLPAFHDLETETGHAIFERFGLTEMEVTDEVFRSPNSRVFEEAENRMHTIKAVMVATIGHQ